MEPSLLVSHSPYATQKVCAPQLSVPRKISARQGAIEAIEANYMTRCHRMGHLPVYQSTSLHVGKVQCWL